MSHPRIQIEKAFPGNFKAYRKAFEAGELEMGKMFVHQHGMLSPKFVINFPTKNHWRSKSKLADVDAGLADLTEQIRRLKIQSIAVPPLGCGLGGLAWSDVHPLIAKHFEAVPDVRVVLFEPKGTPPA